METVVRSLHFHNDYDFGDRYLVIVMSLVMDKVLVMVIFFVMVKFLVMVMFMVMVKV